MSSQVQSDPVSAAWLAPGWLEGKARQLRQDPEHLRKFRNRLLKQGQDFEQARCALPAPLRSLAELSVACDLKPVLHQRSQQDNATKQLFQNARGDLVESVLMRLRSGRNTVCVSSQAGCAVRCTFCATGQSPVVKNLSATQILSQVMHAVRTLARERQRLRNVVFMGMGEPLHNETALHTSLDALISPKHFALSPSHLMVSTVGILGGMQRLVRAFPELGLALSLHSAQPKIRASLIPWSARYELGSLREELVVCNRLQSRPVMLEYLLLEGLTDTDAAIEALLAFCEGLFVRINLIPYNSVDHASFRPTPKARHQAIAATLMAAGYKVTTRRSLGSDIAAACGQLVQIKKGP